MSVTADIVPEDWIFLELKMGGVALRRVYAEPGPGEWWIDPTGAIEFVEDPRKRESE